MGFIIFLIFILIIAAIVFINIKISNFKYRAKQEVLKGTGISSSEINTGLTNAFEKKYLNKFLDEHSNYTEESFKEFIKQYATSLINKEPINEFNENVCTKMQKDSKLEKLQTMQFKRINITKYNGKNLVVMAVYTDNRDEYNMYLVFDIIGEKMQLIRYQISKGVVVGF